MRVEFANRCFDITAGNKSKVSELHFLTLLLQPRIMSGWRTN